MNSIKNRLKAFYLEQEADFDPEETKNVLKTLDGLKDDLSNAGKWDFVELKRLLDSDMDEELYNELDELQQDYLDKQEDEDIFD